MSTATKRRILIIDDNQAIHDDFLKVLTPSAPSESKSELDILEAGLFDAAVTSLRSAQPEQVDIHSAYQGEEGLKCIERAREEGRPFALAFVDMRMPPGWDGLETTARILQADPHVQIVICTAYSDYSWNQMVDRIGTNDRVLILKKPFDNIEVLQLAQSLTEKWHLIQESHARKQSLEQLVEIRTRELASTHAKLNALIESSPVGIIASDSQGRVTTWNPAAQRTFGWSLDEIAMRDRGEAIPGDLRGELDRLIHEWLASNGCDGLELHVACKDGSEIEVSLSTAVLRDALGQVDGLVTIVNDITMRKRVEAELVRAKMAAEAATQAKSDFLANMSHEIRTPMNGVLGMTELLLKTELSAEQREYATTVSSCGEALLTLVNDILDFSKIEAGKLDMECIPFSLRSMLEETAVLLASRAQEKGLDLCCLISANIPYSLLGDPTRLRQVLLNLLSNAIKFTSSGGISISALVESCTDGVAAIRISVRDSGIGMNEEVRSRLFQQFTQADSSTSRNYGGTGLGLAISRRLIELMGGTISVESEAGKGSVFTCRVPLRLAELSAMALPGLNLEGRTALCIDSHAGSRRALREQLEEWEMDCEEADGEAAALALLANGSRLPDLIVIDSHLPGGEGIDLARMIRARIAPEIRPIVLLTPITQRGMSASAIKAGVSGFLTKPIRQGHLYECLRSVLHLNETSLSTPLPLVTKHSIAEAQAAGQCRVLVVDDSMINHRVISMQLKKLGCQVDIAQNGSEALTAVASTAYDLILMDCSMPGMDGFAATRAIRQREKGRARVPIYALTGGAFEDDRERCLAAGMDDIIVKPVSMETLLAALNQACPARVAAEGSGARRLR